MMGRFAELSGIYAIGLYWPGKAWGAEECILLASSPGVFLAEGGERIALVKKFLPFDPYY